ASEALAAIVRRLLDQRIKFRAGVEGIDPRAQIFHLEHDDAHALGDAAYVFGAHPGVGLALAVLVIVGDDNDISATEKFVVVVAPLAEAAGMGGGDIAELNRTLASVPALAVENKFARLHPRNELGQPVKHPAHVPELTNPSALAVRAALTKAVVGNLGVVADDLIQPHALFVVIGIQRAHAQILAQAVALFLRRWLGIKPALVSALPNGVEVGTADRLVPRPAQPQRANH